jgi:hypothetical protein
LGGGPWSAAQDFFWALLAIAEIQGAFFGIKVTPESI